MDIILFYRNILSFFTFWALNNFSIFQVFEHAINGFLFHRTSSMIVGDFVLSRNYYTP